MNPYFLASVLGSMKSPKRVCPKCEKSQVVTVERRGKTVRCKFCGADMPPKVKYR